MRRIFFGPQPPLHDAHQRHRAEVIVEPGIYDQRLEWRPGVALRRGDTPHDGLEDVRYAHAGFGAGADGIAGINTDDVLDFLNRACGIGGRQINLVQYRQDFQIEFGGGVTVRHRLRLHALGGVHNKQRAFAGGQGARHLVGKIHVARSINHVQTIELAIARLVIEGHALGLDGDPALTFEVHGIQHLLLHLARLQGAAGLDKAVRERGFAVINVRDDREIPDVFLVPAHEYNRIGDKKKAPTAPGILVCVNVMRAVVNGSRPPCAV